MTEKENCQGNDGIVVDSMVVISKEQIPGSRQFRAPNRELVKRLNRIPIGKAWVVSENDLGYLGVSSLTAVRVAVKRYSERRLVRPCQASARRFEASSLEGLGEKRAHFSEVLNHMTEAHTLYLKPQLLFKKLSPRINHGSRR